MEKAENKLSGILSTIGCFIIGVLINFASPYIIWGPKSKLGHVVSWNFHILQSQYVTEVWAVSRQHYGDAAADCMMVQTANVINRADDRRDLIDAAAEAVNTGRPSALNLQRLSRIWEEAAQSCHITD